MILHISKKNLQQNNMTKLAFLQFETVLLSANFFLKWDTTTIREITYIKQIGLPS